MWGQEGVGRAAMTVTGREKGRESYLAKEPLKVSPHEETWRAAATQRSGGALQRRAAARRGARFRGARGGEVGDGDEESGMRPAAGSVDKFDGGETEGLDEHGGGGGALR
jgi:hypothetical protein